MNQIFESPVSQVAGRDVINLGAVERAPTEVLIARRRALYERYREKLRASWLNAHSASLAFLVAMIALMIRIRGLGWIDHGYLIAIGLMIALPSYTLQRFRARVLIERNELVRLIRLIDGELALR